MPIEKSKNTRNDNSLKYMSLKQKICPICNLKFLPIRYQHIKFCSPKCKRESQLSKAREYIQEKRHQQMIQIKEKSILPITNLKLLSEKAIINRIQNLKHKTIKQDRCIHNNIVCMICRRRIYGQKPKA